MYRAVCLTVLISWLPTYGMNNQLVTYDAFTTDSDLYWDILYKGLTHNCSSLVKDFLPKLKAININRQDSQGNTLLHIAVKNKDWISTELLLYYGADAFIKNSNGMTPLSLAKKKNNPYLTKVLRRFLLWTGLKKVFRTI